VGALGVGDGNKVIGGKVWKVGMVGGVTAGAEAESGGAAWATIGGSMKG
jgi:hypothetical protein